MTVLTGANPPAALRPLNDRNVLENYQTHRRIHSLNDTDYARTLEQVQPIAQQTLNQPAQSLIAPPAFLNNFVNYQPEPGANRNPGDYVNALHPSEMVNANVASRNLQPLNNFVDYQPGPLANRNPGELDNALPPADMFNTHTGMFGKFKSALNKISSAVKMIPLLGKPIYFTGVTVPYHTLYRPARLILKDGLWDAGCSVAYGSKELYDGLPATYRFSKMCNFAMEDLGAKGPVKAVYNEMSSNARKIFFYVTPFGNFRNMFAKEIELKDLSKDADKQGELSAAYVAFDACRVNGVAQFDGTKPLYNDGPDKTPRQIGEGLTGFKQTLNYRQRIHQFISEGATGLAKLTMNCAVLTHLLPSACKEWKYYPTLTYVDNPSWIPKFEWQAAVKTSVQTFLDVPHNVVVNSIKGLVDGATLVTKFAWDRCEENYWNLLPFAAITWGVRDLFLRDNDTRFAIDITRFNPGMTINQENIYNNQGFEKYKSGKVTFKVSTENPRFYRGVSLVVIGLFGLTLPYIIEALPRREVRIVPEGPGLRMGSFNNGFSTHQFYSTKV